MDKRPLVPADPMEAVIAEDDTLPSDVGPAAPAEQSGYVENEGLATQKARDAGVPIEGGQVPAMDGAEKASLRGRTA